MSTLKENNSNAPPTKFPYAKLIWPIFSLLVLLIFKNPIETLLLGSDDVGVEIFGVKINIAKSDVDELTLLQKEFERETESLNDTITQQNTALVELLRLNEELYAKANDCPNVKAATKQFSKDVDKIMKSNAALKSRTNKFRDKTLFKIPTEEEKKVKKKESTSP
ncbi:MAG: septal ring factor EnvC (AmiA/AmiB activator) [Paraglaciecola sp.]|jgi:septal ring factor EnvC (AmiA/AmiB activator)